MPNLELAGWTAVAVAAAALVAFVAVEAVRHALKDRRFYRVLRARPEEGAAPQVAPAAVGKGAGVPAPAGAPTLPRPAVTIPRPQAGSPSGAVEGRK